ncbi:MAG: hypothetical protein ACTS8H_04050 [Arsenophonus sp. NC-PE1-MAG3]
MSCGKGVWLAKSRDAADKALDILLAKLSVKYPVTIKKLEKKWKE